MESLVPVNFGTKVPSGGGGTMFAVALMLFVVFFAWGAEYLGWQDMGFKAEATMITCFVLGAICGFTKNR